MSQTYFLPDTGHPLKIGADVVAALVKRAARAGSVLSVAGLTVTHMTKVGKSQRSDGEAVAALQVALRIARRKAQRGSLISQIISAA